MFTNDQLRSKTNHFINNSINDGDLQNSETAPLFGYKVKVQYNEEDNRKTSACAHASKLF